MSVIFREKNYDQLILISKNFILISLTIIILVSCLSLVLKNKNKNLTKELVNLKKESLKYSALAKKTTKSMNLKAKNKENYYLLVKLANYAKNLTYKSIYYKKQKMILEGKAKDQLQIFALVNNLKSDNKFKEVDLININFKKQFNFKIKALFYN